MRKYEIRAFFAGEMHVRDSLCSNNMFFHLFLITIFPGNKMWWMTREKAHYVLCIYSKITWILQSFHFSMENYKQSHLARGIFRCSLSSCSCISFNVQMIQSKLNLKTKMHEMQSQFLTEKANYSQFDLEKENNIFMYFGFAQMTQIETYFISSVTMCKGI